MELLESYQGGRLANDLYVKEPHLGALCSYNSNPARDHRYVLRLNMYQITSNNPLNPKFAYASGNVPAAACGTGTPDAPSSRRPTIATPELLDAHFDIISELRKSYSVSEIIGAMKEGHSLLIT